MNGAFTAVMDANNNGLIFRNGRPSGKCHKSLDPSCFNYEKTLLNSMLN
jgi:hypothetical protein